MIPVLLPHLTRLLSHGNESVRKKAIIALHKFHQLDPSVASGIKDSIRKVLCDTSPSVMSASLFLLHDLAVLSPAGNKDLIPSFLNILKQIIDGRLPQEFTYHRVPAPWMQIKLLSILGTLATNDMQASESIYPILKEIMSKADNGVNAGYAVLYEAVKTICKIYPNPVLLDLAATNISKFIAAESGNLKYIR